MRCHICDRLLDKIVLHKITGRIEPCTGCLEVVNRAEYERALEELEQEDVLVDARPNPVSEGDDNSERTVKERLGAGVSNQPVPTRH